MSYQPSRSQAPTATGRQAGARVNVSAIRAFLYGVVALVATAIVGYFFHFVFIGALSLLPLIYGIIGVFMAFRLPRLQGLFFALGGIALGILTFLLSLYFLRH